MATHGELMDLAVSGSVSEALVDHVLSLLPDEGIRGGAEDGRRRPGANRQVIA